jgi:hypothetical protein
MSELENNPFLLSDPENYPDNLKNFCINSLNHNIIEWTLTDSNSIIIKNLSSSIFDENDWNIELYDLNGNAIFRHNTTHFIACFNSSTLLFEISPCNYSTTHIINLINKYVEQHKYTLYLNNIIPCWFNDHYLTLLKIDLLMKN